MLYEEDTIALLAVGSMVSTAEHIREKLHRIGCRCSLINGRFIKPVDFEMIDRIAAGHQYLVTLEENVLRGGYGEQVLAYVESRYPDLRVICVTLPDAYVEHGNVTLLRSVLGIDSDSIMKQLCEEIPCLREKASAEEEAE
jgi:1-deoxy-D-xylulose-5-phosphate synthase